MRVFVITGDNRKSVTNCLRPVQGADRALVVDVQNERIRLQNLSRPPRHNVSMSSSEGSLAQDVR